MSNMLLYSAELERMKTETEIMRQRKEQSELAEQIRSMKRSELPEEERKDKKPRELTFEEKEDKITEEIKRRAAARAKRQNDLIAEKERILKGVENPLARSQIERMYDDLIDKAMEE